MYPSLVPFPSSSPELIPILIVIFTMLKNVFILVPLIYVLPYTCFKPFFFLNLFINRLVALYWVNLAKLELHFPEFPSLHGSGLGLATGEICMILMWQK